MAGRPDLFSLKMSVDVGNGTKRLEELVQGDPPVPWQHQLEGRGQVPMQQRHGLLFSTLPLLGPGGS